jgi:hypothetical protein
MRQRQLVYLLATATFVAICILHSMLLTETSPWSVSASIHDANLGSSDLPSDIQQPIIKIAYAITISKCESLQNNALQAAPLMAHHVRAMSHRRGSSSSNVSKYDHHLYAFASKTQVESVCVDMLERFGYTVLLLDIPISEERITNQFYKERLSSNGCCGAHEFLKLHAYTLTNYPVVIHLDLDTMLLQPLEDVIDFFIHPADETLAKLQIMRPPGGSAGTIQAMFTRDYQQVVTGFKKMVPYTNVPVQGGFFAVRPNMTVFDELIAIIHQANYTHLGWGGVMNSAECWGDPQIQGLLAYYYSFLERTQGLELHHCYYNNILGDYRLGDNCTTQVEPCMDCSTVPPSEVKLSHPIFCHKPWACTKWGTASKFKRAPSCRWYLHKWYETRQLVEEEWSTSGRTWTKTVASGTLIPEVFLGYCHDNRSVIHMEFTNGSLI